MSWIRGVKADTAYEKLLAHNPDLLARYRAFYRTFWEDELIPARMLELCRLRIAAIHGCTQEWGLRDARVNLPDSDYDAIQAAEFSRFSVAERAALELAEKMCFQHHQITDLEITEIEKLLGSAVVIALLTAMAFFDVTCRLKLVMDIEAQAAVLDSMPLQKGSLA